MTNPKDKKKKKDTDFTDEMGGGEDDVFAREDFIAVLKKMVKKKPSGEGKSQTSG